MAIESEGVVGKDVRFTPGPWRIDGDSNGIHIRPGRSGHIVAFISTNWVLYGAGGGDAHANARLIAAAPDLLEACESALLIDESDSASVDPAEIFAGIRAALAKAEGK